jgi:protein-S-isoprenylcysteine O-methyltransferase Ste14
MDETSAPPMQSTRMRIHPPLLALLSFLVTLGLHMLLPLPRTVFPHHVLGLLLAAAGVGLCAYAAAIFAARDTTKNPYGEPAKLVTIPPYTISRNPMYLGLTTVLLGLAAFFDSPIMLLAPIVFAVVIDRVVIPNEEQTMEHIFGAEYLAYKDRVRRWL